MRAGRVLGAALLAAVAGALPPAAPLEAQRVQWTDVVYVPGAWQGASLVRTSTRSDATESLALLMRIDYFANPPRWRAEIRRSPDGRTFGDAEILLGERSTALVVTRLGTTPLDQHALGRDTLVRAAAAVFDGAGRRQGVASGRFAERLADGSVGRVVFRRTARSAEFSDDMLNPRNASAGRQLLAGSLTAVGDQRSASVVATAGARGVDRVRTPGGEVAVTPDTMAVVRMERFVVGAFRLEDFLRMGGLGPYAATRRETRE